MMSLWDALRMNMMISYQELVRTFPNYFAALEARRDKRRYLLLAWVVITILLNFIHLGGG